MPEFLFYKMLKTHFYENSIESTININQMQITIDLETLPDLFKQSRIYKSLIISTQSITLFPNVCHFDLTMHSYRDLCRTMETLRYWQFNKTPTQVYCNVIGHEHKIRDIFIHNSEDLFLRYETFSPLFEVGILAFGNTYDEQCRTAQDLKFTSLIEYLESCDHRK